MKNVNENQTERIKPETSYRACVLCKALWAVAVLLSCLELLHTLAVGPRSKKKIIELFILFHLSTRKKRMGRRDRHRRRRNPSDEKSVNVSSTCVELMGWFRAHRDGFRPPGPSLRLSVFPDTGRGLMAMRPIPEKEVLMGIPIRFLITRKTVENSMLLSSKSINLAVLTTHHLIAVFLLGELDLGPDSFWCPYLKTLPGSYSVPFFCNSLHLDVMPKYVKEKCLRQQKVVNSAFEKVKSVLNLEVDFDRFAWAWFTVNTRAVYFDNNVGEDQSSENNLALAPFLDMFNHSGDVAVNVGVAKSPHFPEGVYQIVSASRSYKKFDQVFINYGPHDNLKLCLEYGFVLEDNVNDLVPLSLEELVESVFLKSPTDKRVGKAISFIKVQGLDKNLGIVPGADPFTWNTLSCLFVMNNFSKPECWSKIFSMDSEHFLSDAKTRNSLEIILTSRLAEAETFLSVSLSFTSEESTTPSPSSLAVVRQLVEIHRNLLADGLESLKRRFKAKR